MTGPEIMAVVGFFVMLFGALFGVWKYLDGRLASVRTEASNAAASATAVASLAREELAAHKLHTAQNYVTKQGMQESTAQLLRAIEGLGSRIDSISERIDRAFERGRE